MSSEVSSEKQLSPSILKVAADPENILEEDRKRNVKKLAGAIAQSLRANGEVNVRAFGKAAIAKGVKALCIARRFVDVAGVDGKKLSLFYSPAFITTQVEATSHGATKELTGICFCTFASEKTEADDVDLSQVTAVLKVAADPRDISADERKRKVKKLAAAIAHSVEDNKECVVRAIGKVTIAKASKALAIARGLTATKGPDLYCWSDFIVAQMDAESKEKTGIAFYTFTNETTT